MEAGEPKTGEAGRPGGGESSVKRCCGVVLRSVKENFGRYCVSGFVQNFSQYYYWILVPLVAEDLGATAWQLGLIQAIGGLVYSIVSFVVGSTIIEKVRAGILSRIAFTFFIVACAIALSAKFVWVLYIVVVVSGSANAFYWGPIQNAVGQEAGKNSDHKTALFCVFHALGKSVCAAAPE